MSVAATLTELGGCATWVELRKVHPKRKVRDAAAEGAIVRVSRGRYVLGSVAGHRRFAHARSAALSHLSAAQHHGWKVKTPPDRPWVIVPRHRKVSAEDRGSAVVHYAELTKTERSAGVTAPLRTVLDCARTLAFDEALAVADSALRSGDVDPDELRRVATRLRGNGSAQARRVAAVADGRAANPLESVLRAIVLDIPGVAVDLQHIVADDGVFAVVDLSDPSLRLVIEAEGYEYHGSRDDWRRDCRRYTEIVAARWWVLRFTFEDIMYHPARVRAAIERWLSEPACTCGRVA